MSGPTISLFPNAHAVAPLRRRWAPALVAALLLAACGGDVETRMAEVRALQDVGQFQASIEELRDLLATEPDLPEANYRLGLALVQTGEPSRAVWPLQKAADSSEYEITAGILLASTHFQTKNYDESVRAANRVLEIDPERQAALRIRANAYLSARQLEKALEDTTRLKDLYPDDYGVRALHATVLADLGRLDEAEEEHDFVKQLGQESEDPEFRIRACLAPAVFAKDVLKDDEKARGLYEDCASRTPTDLVALNHIVSFFDGVGDTERGTELVRASAASAPESLPLQQTLANRLNQVGRPDEAEQVLRKAVEDFGSATAWSGLADFYRARKQPEKAIEAIEKVNELSGGGSDALRFTHADTLIDMGDLDAARQVAGQIQQPTYAALIRGRIALLSGDPQAALASFEQGINAWPNNAGARYLAGLAARELGDYDRAVSELREAVRSGNEETDAAIELARIFLAQGKYQQAVTFSTMALRGPRGPDQSEAYVVAARAASAQGQYERARTALTKLEGLGYPAIATRERAILERAVSGPEGAIAAVEKSGLDLTDPENIPVLQQLVDALTTAGRNADARARVDAALAAQPDRPELHELRGLVLGRSGDGAAARSAFEKALELDPERASSLTGIATLTANEGDVPKAIELFDRAYALDRSDGTPAYSAAQLSLVGGNREEAKRRLRDVVRHHPEIPGAANDLAWLLAEEGEDLDTALSLAQAAQRRNNSPEVLDTLGWVHFRRGEHDQAVETLQQAVAGRSDSPSIRYHLGAALRAAGEEQQAKEMLTAALELGAFPEAEQARAELARLKP